MSTAYSVTASEETGITPECGEYEVMGKSRQKIAQGGGHYYETR